MSLFGVQSLIHNYKPTHYSNIAVRLRVVTEKAPVTLSQLQAHKMRVATVVLP